MVRPVVPALLALLTLALGASGAGLVPVASLPGAAPCAHPVNDAVMGPVCPVPGGFLMLGRDGVARFTHGPDPLPVLSVLPAYSAPEVNPFCVESPTAPSIRVIYARPADRPDRYDSLVGTIRDSVRYSNAIVLAEALPLGADIRLRILCEPGGDIAVAHAVLPTPAGDASFGSIDFDLRRMGYGDAQHKEWVVYDGAFAACGCGGISNLWGDDRPGAENLNNGGGFFSVTFLGNYGTGVDQNLAFLDEVMLHEISHNLGAVQLSAPHSSGAFHCNDGTDIMCYADGGSDSRYSDLDCPGNLVGGLGAPYDCGHNDYFHPFPPAGSYLETHWNVASSVNRFVQRIDLPAHLG